MTQLVTQVASETPPGARAIKGLSAAVGVSPATYYRHRQSVVRSAGPPRGETAVRQEIQQIALEMPNYGYRSPGTAAPRPGRRS